MPKTDEELAAIVADPEFAKFSAAQRAKILKDATKGRAPLVLQSSADPAPKAPRPIAEVIAEDRAAKNARRIDPMAAQRPTLLDELSAAVPGYETTLKPADAAARQQRLAQAPLPGSAASIARTTRETVGDLVAGGLTGQMLLAPNQRAMEAFDRQQRLASPDLATRMGQQAADRASLLPPLVTQAARNQTASEQAGAMLRGARQMAGDFVEGVAGPVRDLAQEPSRLLPTSPGFAEGAASALASIPTAIATDPVSDALFGGAGLLASKAAKAITPAARGLGKAAEAMPAEPARPTLDTPSPPQPDVTPPVEKLSTPADMPPLPPRPEVALMIEDANRLQQAIKEAPAALPGARRGSLGRAGRDPSEPFRAGQEAVNKSFDAKVRELIKERQQAELDGNAARVMQIDGEIQAIDDARVVIPMPGETFVTIADLQNDLAAAQAAGDTATATRLERQIRKARASNYHNPTKYGFMSQESTDKFNATLEQAAAKLRAEGRDPKTRVPFDEIRSKAAEINPLAVEQMARKGLKRGESLTAAEYEAAKNYLQQLVEDSVEVERRVNAIQAAQHGGPVPLGADGNPINPAELGQALTVEQARLHQLENDIMGLHGIVTQSRSQKGRDLAYLKMIAQQGWDTGYWLARANRTSGGVATSEQISAISQIVVRGQQADDAVKRAQLAGDAVAEAAARQEVYNARVDLAKQMGKITITPWLEALSAARKAGLLTGLKTIQRNTLSNALNFGLEGVVNAVGAVPDAFLGMFTGNRTTFVPRVASIARGLNEVRTRGIPEFRQTMIHGMPLDQLAALEIPREINTPNNAFNFYVNTVLRFQSAQDRLFKAYAMRRSLDDQARSLVTASASRTTPRPTAAQMEASIRNLSENPTEEMVMQAVADAEFATFQNDTDVSTAISATRRALPAGGRFALDLFQPFIKTPASIGTRVVADFATPYRIGEVMADRRARVRLERLQNAPAIEWMTREEQKALSKAFARNAIGAGLIWLGSRLYDEGRLTGSDQPDRREENMAAGRIPNAIKVAGEWMPLNPFSPVGTLLSLGATMNRDGRDLDNTSRGFKTAAQVFALMLDQPFTQGMKQFVEVAGDTGGKKMNRFAGSLAGSVVPTIVAETAQAFDPGNDMRAIDYGSMTAAMAQNVQNRLPLLRQGLPVANTGLGDPRNANTGLRAYSALAGTPAREDYDPIVREVLITGANVPRVATDVKLTRKHAPIPLTAQEQQDLLRSQGAAAREAVGEMLADTSYTSEESPDVQRELLSKEISKAAARAKKDWIDTYWDILEARQAQQDEKDRIKRGTGRAVVGPLNTAP